MNRILILGVILVFSLISIQTKAGGWNYYNNFTQITDAEPIGNETFITAKGGVLINNNLTGAKKYFTTKNSSLPSNSVEQVAKSAVNGDIWIGTYDNGLARWTGTDFVRVAYPTNFGLLTAMMFGPDGNLYMQSSNGAFKYNISTNVFTQFNRTNADVWLYDAWSFDFNSAGNLVVFTGTTCLEVDINSMNIIDSFDSLTTPLVTGCSPSSSKIFNLDNNNVLFNSGNFQIGIIHRDGTSSDVSTGLPIFSNIVVNRGVDGILYSLIDNVSVYKLVGVSWQKVYDLPSGDYAMNLIYEDGTKSILEIYNSWGSINNVDVFTHNSSNIHLNIIPKKYVFDSNNMTSMFKDDAGDIYTVTATNIYKYNKSTDDWAIQMTAPSIFGVIRSVRWYNGKIYADNYGNLIEFYNGTSWVQIPKASGYSSGSIYSYDVSSSDIVFFSNNEGVFKYESGITSRIGSYTEVACIKYDEYRNIIWIAKSNELIKHNITTGIGELIINSSEPTFPAIFNASNIVLNQNDHSVWFLENDNRILKYDGTHFSTIVVPDADMNFVSDVKFTADNKAIIRIVFSGIGGNGLYTLDGSTWSRIHSSLDPSIISNNINDLLIDNDGHFWCSYNDNVGVGVYKNYGTIINNPIEQSTFNVYPNPANEQLNIELLNENVDITLIDMKGNNLVSTNNKTDKSIHISTDKLANGIYLLKAGTTTKKILIQH